MLGGMEQSWFAIAGKNEALTELELQAQMAFLGGSSLLRVTDSVFQIKGPLPNNQLLDRLGSVVKAGRIVELCQKSQWEKVLAQLAERTVEPRIDFGLSMYGPNVPHKSVERLSLQIKKTLRQSGKAVRALFDQKEPVLSAVVVQKQLLDKRGQELVLIPAQDEWLIGVGTWVHPFEAWSRREYDKEMVDTERGMLPHKLARIMLNVTGLDLGPEVTVYDPFCGVGTVLIEAKELGCAILGSDNDPKAVQASIQNLHLPLQTDLIWQGDSRSTSLPKITTKHLAIVTEPYLGPVWPHAPNHAEKDRVITELTVLYRVSLAHWRAHIPKGAPIVMVCPVIFGSATWPKLVDGLSQLAYSVSYGPVRYKREDQLVERDIVKLVAR